jgi:D-glycero-D-manno-heptose 1,7-bisphosphate phosphatase
MTRLVLIDRDGVLNEDRADHVRNPGQLVMIPRAAEACSRLNRAGIKLAIVTNQSGVGQGLLSLDMLERIHEQLRQSLAAQGAHVDLILTCTEPPWSDHERRKPRPGMLLEAMRHFRVPAEDTVMIGDQLTDLQAAFAAGVRRVLVRTGKGAELQAKGLPDDILPVAVYDNLHSATDALLLET